MTQEQHALGISSSSFGNNSKGGVCCGSGGGGGDDGNNNNNGGGGSGGGGSGCNNNKPPTKNANNKPKKIPQRGLGVAQLEKMRLEEERKGEAADILSGDFHELPNNPTSRLTVERENILRPNHAPHSFHFPSKQPNASFQSEIPHHHPHFAGSEMPNHGNAAWSRFRGGDYNHEADTTSRLFRFRAMPHETSVQVLSYPGVPQRPKPLTNATANIPLGISPESALNLQIEPPSNQSFRVSSYSSSFSSEDKMIGTKRPYPFGPETSSTPYFSGHFRPSFAAPRSSSVELTLGHRGHAPYHVEPRNKYFRVEGQSSSSPLPEPNPVEDAKIIGDFLTLAPPNVSLPPVESKDKIVIDYSDRRTRDVSASASLNQEHVRGQMHNQQGPSRSTARPFSFFPDKPNENQSTSDVRNEDEEKGDTIDLNLKL